MITIRDSGRFLVVPEQAEQPEGLPEDVTVIRVENGRNALALLSAARFGYPAGKMVTIGVTGTKGKTTTTYMIKSILEACGKKVGLIGTNGAVIGDKHYATKNTTPESYLLEQYFDEMVKAGCEYMGDGGLLTELSDAPGGRPDLRLRPVLKYLQ